jgi:hypothetical protein
MSRRVFNQKNFLGRHCLQAIIPGWHDNNFTRAESAANPGDVGYLQAVGQKMEFVDTNAGTGVCSTRTVTEQYGHLGTCRALRLDQTASNDFVGLLRSDNDEGIDFPDKSNLTIVGIVKPSGDGRPGGGGDPRIYSKDIGAGEIDHDLMIGIATGGNDARTRIRIGTNTSTVLRSSVIQDNALNLIAGTVSPANASQVNVRVHHIGENGVYSFANHFTGAITGEYNPRTTTTVAIGANAGADDNAFEGDIIGIWAFDRALEKDEFLEFFANPWQVFAPQRYFVPLTVGEAVVLEEPAATNALGTPQIAELIASGQVVSILKASGAVVLAPLTSAGAAALVSGVLAATGSPTFDELLSSGAAQRTSVNITDVNTTESWTDGSSSIPISGSGFS